MIEGRHSKVRLLTHFIWTTYGRSPLITPDLEPHLYAYITKVCADDGCSMVAIGGMPDHVHLLLYLGHNIPLSDLMRHVKGGSSRFASLHVGGDIPFRWQRGCAAFGVSPHDKQRVALYIKNQKQHHEEGTLWLGAEDAYEEDLHSPGEAS